MKNLMHNTKRKKNWRSFEEARDYARSLGLKSSQEWLEFARGNRSDLGLKPDDIPVRPLIAYKLHGWCGYRNWLGLPCQRWRTYRDARAFVRQLNLQTPEEWQLYCKGEFCDKIGVKPENIPVVPNVVYKEKGWISWGDFLGNGVIEVAGKTYEPFAHAREYVRSLKLKSQTEWVALCKGKDLKTKDLPIPVFPNSVYRGYGWTSWQDWLGVIAATPNWNYEEARDFVRSLKLKSNMEWRKYCRGEFINKPPLPDGITLRPEVTYKNKGWTSWGDFLGTGNIAATAYKFRSFEDARDFVQQLKLQNEGQWRKYCKSGNKPDDIPTNPHRQYRGKWQGMGDWLGTGRIACKKRKYRAFSQARSFVHKLKFKNATEWREYCKSGNKPRDIPGNPHIAYYYKGWISWGDWLNNGNVHGSKIKHLSYEDARDFVRKLGIKTCTEWRLYLKGEMQNLPEKPLNIPADIEFYYKNKGWTSWKCFLGTEKS